MLNKKKNVQTKEKSLILPKILKEKIGKSRYSIKPSFLQLLLYSLSKKKPANFTSKIITTNTSQKNYHNSFKNILLTC
jgi:hypothetical protein